MVLLMSRPAKRSGSTNYQYRKRVPADVQEAARGQRLVITFPAEAQGESDDTAIVTFGKEAKFSLKTRDPLIAKVRTGLATAQLEKFFDGLRNGPRHLTHKECVALAGIIRNKFIADWKDDPGEPDNWDLMISLEYDKLEISGELERSYGRQVDNLLASKGIMATPESRTALIRETAYATADAAQILRRYAEGDYRPDKAAQRYPEWRDCPDKAEPSETSDPSLTLDDIFERWQRERQPSASTVTTWSSYVRALKKHLGHDDAGRVTKADILAWKNTLVEKGYSAKGIKDGQLASVRTLFAYAVDNDLLSANPAADVRIQVKRKAGTKKLPYEDAEVARILELANKEKKPELRWLPWLIALSGARVGEVAQLWGSRVKRVQGVYVMELAPAEDGGSLKNENSERTVPIHPAIIERGFLDFVLTKGEGPLFYGGGRKATIAAPGKRHASKGPTNRLAAWIRAQGFTDPRKAPNHAFRHWFKTACQNTGVLDSIADAIQGHSGSRGEADGYRHASIAVMSDAISRINVPSICKSRSDEEIPKELAPEV